MKINGKGLTMKKNRSSLAIINLDLNKAFTKNSHKLSRELLQQFITEGRYKQK